MKPSSTVWSDAPQLALPNNPAFVSHCNTAWLAYETSDSSQGLFAVVRFDGLIDLHLSPINDEGLGSHPYASAGLRPYEFNELFYTAELRKWINLNARQFAITFKDVAIDVIARDAVVLNRGIVGVDAHSALLAVARSITHTGG